MAGRQPIVMVRRYFPKVQKVVDASEGLEINVTPMDERMSKKKDHNHCALATACQRELNLDGIIVSIKTVYAVKGKLAVRYKLPESTSREIVSFDRGAAFAPGVYKLRAPHPTEQLGSRPGHGGPGRRGKKKRPAPHVTTGVRAVLRSM